MSGDLIDGDVHIVAESLMRAWLDHAGSTYQDRELHARNNETRRSAILDARNARWAEAVLALANAEPTNSRWTTRAMELTDLTFHAAAVAYIRYRQGDELGARDKLRMALDTDVALMERWGIAEAEAHYIHILENGVRVRARFGDVTGAAREILKLLLHLEGQQDSGVHLSALKALRLVESGQMWDAIQISMIECLSYVVELDLERVLDVLANEYLVTAEQADDSICCPIAHRHIRALIKMPQAKGEMDQLVSVLPALSKRSRSVLAAALGRRSTRSALLSNAAAAASDIGMLS